MSREKAGQSGGQEDGWEDRLGDSEVREGLEALTAPNLPEVKPVLRSPFNGDWALEAVLSKSKTKVYERLS